MSNFKTYKEAEEFNENNYPVQTRKVLFEKTEQQLRSSIFRYFRELSDEEKTIRAEKQREITLELLEKRKTYISTLTNNSSQEDYLQCFSEIRKNNETKSDFLVICETLF